MRLRRRMILSKESLKEASQRDSEEEGFRPRKSRGVYWTLQKSADNRRSRVLFN